MQRKGQKESDRAAGCFGKQPLSESIARRVVKQSDRGLQPYYCKFCKNWHVGGGNGRVIDRRKQGRKDDSENQLDSDDI